MKVFLCLAFFVSGMAALIFETLWFRLAGLTFGNSVWAATIVLSGFMGGLAIGNAFSVRYGQKIKYPVRVYALIEALIAITGLALVLIFPMLTEWLAPLFRPFLNKYLALNIIRLSIAFLLMLIPSSAMGATLPIMVKALHTENPNFGQTLGQLYGWNTLGAVLGALIGDLFLIKLFGVKGTGIIAAFFSMSAALGAIWISRKFINAKTDVIAAELSADKMTLSDLLFNNKRLLFAGFLSGGILLALEVVWFRFLMLFFPSRTLIFSIMLSIVLAGIGIGGLIASLWLRFQNKAYKFLAPLLFISGIMVAVLYSSFDFGLSIFSQSAVYTKYLFPSLYLMFPVSMFSGIIFTMIGASLHTQIHVETGTTGLLTLSNTIGAMLGSAIAGFILIPKIGMEKSFFLLALLYGGIAVLVINKKQLSGLGKGRYLSYTAALVFILSLIFFPFGLMGEKYLQFPRKEPQIKYPSLKVEMVREGLTETIQYLRSDVFGEPYYYRLITNDHSMAATNIAARRYMKLFVYWPIAVNPKIKNALLISYGVGSTAKALTDTESLESIHIVDISKDIIETSNVVFSDPKENPISDPRVKVHIEDGRFFLLTTPKRFDLITSEPPPPKNSGVVNLYTQEYFQLIYDRLTESGIVTYWLPVRELMEPETKSILKAFCNVFDDCSLWTGARLELMMIGTRHAQHQVSESEFVRQWNDTVVEKEMNALGLEAPEQLATLLVADTNLLKEITKDSLPLTDNYPMRLITNHFSAVDITQYQYWILSLFQPERFKNSFIVQRLWPANMRIKSENYIESQRIINNLFDRSGDKFDFASLHAVLTKTSLKSPILWLMNSNADKQRNVDKAIAKGMSDKAFYYYLAVQALSERDYALAEQNFSVFQRFVSGEEKQRIYFYRIYLSLMLGQKQKSKALVQELITYAGDEAVSGNQDYWEWLKKTFNLTADFKIKF